MIIPIDDHYEIVAIESESGGSVGIRRRSNKLDVVPIGDFDAIRRIAESALQLPTSHELRLKFARADLEKARVRLNAVENEANGREGA